MSTPSIIKSIGDINKEIVLVIAEDGTNLGEMSTADALVKAEEENLDLVVMKDNDIPICKIMNYGKYHFEQQKKEKLKKKNQKQVVKKEIQLSCRIDRHDMETKAKQAKKFLNSGNIVSVVMRLKGRENAFVQQGIEIMQNFSLLCETEGKLQGDILHSGNQILMTIVPNN